MELRSAPQAEVLHGGHEGVLVDGGGEREVADVLDADGLHEEHQGVQRRAGNLKGSAQLGGWGKGLGGV